MTTAKLELLADSRQVRTATSDLEQLNRTGTQSEIVAGKASRGLGAVGKSAGQASIQLQQFIGQVQGGQSALVALSQQSADLGFVLGAPLLGALVSIGAAVGGMAFAALSGSEDVTTLEEAVKRLGDAVVISDDGVALLSAEIERLATVSRDAAMAQLAQEIIDAKNVIQVAGKEVKAAYSDLTSGLNLSVITVQLERYKAAMEEGGEAARIATKGISQRPDLETKDAYAALEQSIRTLSAEYNISRESALEFLQATSAAAKGADPAAIQNLQNVLSGLSAESGFTNEKLAELQNKLSDAFSEARNAGEIMTEAKGFLEDFDSALNGATGTARDFATKTEQLTTQLRIQNMELQGMGLEAALYAAALATGKESADDLDDAVRQLITDNYRLAESKRKVKIDAKDQAEAQRELLRELRAEQEQIIKNRNERNKITGAFTDVQQGIAADLGGEAEQARQQLQARLDVIREYAAIEGADREAALQAQFAAELAYEQRITQMKLSEAEARKQIQLQQLDSTAQFLGQAAQIAAQAGESGFSAYKAFAKAQAIVGTYSSAVKAYDALAGIQYVGPALGAAAAGAAVAFGLKQVSAINAAKPQGARAQGGQVLGGNQYLVGERGPELVTMRGNGNVTPFNQLMRESGGSNVQVSVNVQNYSGAEVKTQTRSETLSNGQRREILDIIVGDITQRGRVHSAITSTTTAGGRVD